MASSKKKKKSATKKKTSTSKSTKKSTSTKKASSTKKSSAAKKNLKKTSTKNKDIDLTKVKKASKKKEEDLSLPVLKEKKKVKPLKVKKIEEIKNDVDLPKEKKHNIFSKLFKKKKKSNAKKIASKKKSSSKKNFDKLVRKIKMYGIKSVVPKKYILSFIGVVVSITLMVLLILFIPKHSGKIDLQLIPSNVDYLNTVAFDINKSNDIISDSKAYSDLTEYYEYHFDKVFKLDKQYVSDYFIKYNPSNKQAFIVIKPSNDNHDKVEEVFNKFFSSIGVSKYEYFNYQGYLFYINSSNNTLVKSKIMQTQIRVFNILKTLSKDDILDELGIDEKYYSEALVKTSMVIATDTCQYVIIKPRNLNAKNAIKDAMNKYYEKLESKWKDKNIDNYNLVVNRLETEYSGYLIYIISHDNSLAFELIKSY